MISSLWSPLRRPDRAERDPDVPHGVGPAVDELEHPLGTRVGGEVEVVAQPAEQGVAHRSAHEGQLVPGHREQLAQLEGDARVRGQRGEGGADEVVGEVGAIGGHVATA